MKQNQNRKVLSTILCIAVISVFSLTIAYAVLSETLTISGSGTVNASNWNIAINNSTSYTNTSSGSATFTPPTVSGTTISYTVNLTKPDDSITLYFDGNNNGDISGEITSIVSSTPICTSSTGNTTDASLVCDNLEITLQYANGNTLSVGDVINADGYTCLNGASTGDNTTHIKLIVKLKDTMTAVPSSQVTISNLKHDIIYSQTSKTCTTSTCFTAGTKVSTATGYKNIEDIEVGDYVYSYNIETKTKELKRVIETFKHQKDEIYTLKVNNQLIHTTKEHQFYVVDRGWKQIQKLDFDDKLLSIKNGPLFIDNIKINNYREINVYNFEVEDNHNYLVTTEEILVHNKKEPVPRSDT